MTNTGRLVPKMQIFVKSLSLMPCQLHRYACHDTCPKVSGPSPSIPCSTASQACNVLSWWDLNHTNTTAAGKYLTSPSLKARVWNFLEDFERQLGFHTRSRVKQLQTHALREKV